MGDFVQFRFVPTMRCNLRCSYCFLPRPGSTEPTMFDAVAPAAWVDGMAHFSEYEVEFYLSGGEPFCIPGTYDLVRGFCELPFVRWARIDTNLMYADRVLELCPSSKVKLLCSWHTEAMSFETFTEKILMVKQHDMLGMVNFVASDKNMKYLDDNGLQLDEIVRDFQRRGVFINVAGDFGKGSGGGYRRFITRYTSPEDWEHIHGFRRSRGSPCGAGATSFTVRHDGRLQTCARPGAVVGDFLSGKIERVEGVCPERDCRCIVHYCHRRDNSIPYRRHLEGYVERNTAHRLTTGVLGSGLASAGGWRGIGRRLRGLMSRTT
jgi:hypothetical protein